jgi:hypothetical protein
MADSRTTVTELATALGMLGFDDVAAAIAARPVAMVNLTSLDWDRLEQLWSVGLHRDQFSAGFANGRAFLDAPDALRGRIPVQIEWKGSHRAPGDDVVPADLRVDHVYLVSCKYLSKNLQNRSPSRVFEHLLGPGSSDPGDWYVRTAPDQYQALYEAAVASAGLAGLPDLVADLDRDGRTRLRASLQARHWPPGATIAYADLCQVVSERSANIWSANISSPARAEALLWRLLRISHAPYFILGSDRDDALRLRICTPWDWRQQYRLRRLQVHPTPAGQPEVGWLAECTETASGHTKTIAGRVEIRWSHGRFGQHPEAKVYLETSHHDVPGYLPL